jgi:hypothetical protein
MIPPKGLMIGLESRQNLDFRLVKFALIVQRRDSREIDPIRASKLSGLGHETESKFVDLHSTRAGIAIFFSSCPNACDLLTRSPVFVRPISEV